MADAASSFTVHRVTTEPPAAQRRAGRRLGSLVSALLAISIAVSLFSDTPERLPGVALGSPTLLHAERTVALFAGLLLALLVLARAFQGRLPSELSGRGVRYAERERTEEIRDATASALEGLEAAHRELAARVDALEEEPNEGDFEGPSEGERG